MTLGAKDVRLVRRGQEVLDAIVSTGSLVLRTVGNGRAGEVAAGRFLDNDDVTTEAILAAAAEHTLAAARGRRVLAIQDTTEVNFSGRAVRRSGLGPAGDGVTPGLFCHPTLLLDIEHAAVLGLTAAEIWTRDPAAPKAGSTAAKRRPIDDKESGRWLTATQGCQAIREVAAQVVSVSDREGDIYEHFAACPPGVDMIVRARHNRATASGTPLFTSPETFDLLAVASLTVPPRGPGVVGHPFCGHQV